MRYLIKLIILFFLVSNYFAISNEKEIIQYAKTELERAFTSLQNQKNPPYFISYSITEIEQLRIVSSFGKLKSSNKIKRRILDIDLRVGSYKFDNTHIIRGSAFGSYAGRSSIELPLENDEIAIRTTIWSLTDKAYKSAIERYEKALTNKAVKVQEEDTSADFSIEKPYVYYEKKTELNIDDNKWVEILNSASAVFLNYPNIYEGSSSFTAEVITKYYVNTEGSEIVTSQPYIRIFISASTKADDGMSLPLYQSYFGYKEEELPSQEQLRTDAKNIADLLMKLREAPLMTTYSGPAILSGEASGVFFHEIFGHRVEGHRQKDPNSSQTFKSFIGKKILPEFIDVWFDPTITHLQGKPISGYYKFDDEGIEAQKVLTVENGIFKNFLMSRTPIENFPNSNGHGRRQAGYRVVSRQSNLIVSAKKTVPLDSLRSFLISECKKQGKEYGLFFQKVQGGFTFTGTTIPNAFNVNPILVYKIYTDGRPDELVRGVDLIGTPLTTFSNVTTAGNDLGIFNGMCGAESGSVPVSACSPSLLVSLIEVQRKSKSQAKPPILPSPIVFEYIKKKGS